MDIVMRNIDNTNSSQPLHTGVCIEEASAYITPGLVPGYNHVVGYVATHNPEMLWLLEEPFVALYPEASRLRVKAAMGNIIPGPKVPPPPAIRRDHPERTYLRTYRDEDLRAVLGF